MTVDAKVRARYLRAYDRATDEQKAAGRAWYPRVSAVADGLAGDAGITREMAAGVIAALSPRETWARNVINARAAVKGEPFGALGNSKRAAARILAGERVDDVLGGQKTRAFARACAGDLDAAVIDVWMLRAAGDDARKGASVKRYHQLAETLASAARARGERVAAFQAIVWIVVRGSAE